MKKGVLASVCLLLAGCLSAPSKPPVTTPPAPPTYTIFAHVCDGEPCAREDEPHKHPGALVTFTTNGTDYVEVADGSGNVIVHDLVAGTRTVCASAAGYVKACATVTLPRPEGQDVFLLLVQDVPPVVSLRVDGKVFHDGFGALWPWRGVTAFTALRDLIGGRDLNPYFAARAAAGANLARVLMTMRNIADLRPEQYTDGQIGALMAAAHAHGLRLELVALADAQDWPLSAQQAQVQRIANVIAANGCLDVLEVANEPFKNSAPPTDILRGLGLPSCVLVATGDYNIPDHATAFPVVNYLTYHSERDAEWPRKAKDAQDIRDGFDWNGGGSFPGVHVPVVDDEPMGADEIDQPGKRSNHVDDFYWLGATATLMSAGATFHSTAGITTQDPGPVQAAAERAFFAGMQAIPAETQTWQYTRGGLANNPLEHDDALALRTFCKIGGGEAWCVAIRPTPAWRAVARDGWHIVASAGPQGSVLHLQR